MDQFLNKTLVKKYFIIIFFKVSLQVKHTFLFCFLLKLLNGINNHDMNEMDC
jgi:hypothetical protein